MKKNNFIPQSRMQFAKTQMIKKRSAQNKFEMNITGNAFNISLLIACYALRNEFDFGTNRLERFLDRFNKTLEGYNEGYVNFSQINEVLHEETGLWIVNQDGVEAIDKHYVFREDR